MKRLAIARAFAAHQNPSEARGRRKRQERLYSLFTVGGACLARRVRIANTFFSRFVGLLARCRLASDEGLLLCPGGTVHTFGMRFAIDLVFLDADLRVKAFCRRVQPWRIALAPPGTAAVAELPAGRIESMKLDAMEQLVLRSLGCESPMAEKENPP